MVEDVGAHSRMDSGGESDLQFCADAVGARHQNGISPAFAIELEQRAESADGSQNAPPERFSRHGGDAPLGFVSNLNIHAGFGVAHEPDSISAGVIRWILENVKQASPAYFSEMNQGSEIGLKSFADVSGLPNFLGRINRHVNNQGRTDNVLAGDKAPETAVVRVVAIVAHHEVLTF